MPLSLPKQHLICIHFHRPRAYTSPSEPAAVQLFTNDGGRLDSEQKKKAKKTKKKRTSKKKVAAPKKVTMGNRMERKSHSKVIQLLMLLCGRLCAVLGASRDVFFLFPSPSVPRIVPGKVRCATWCPEASFGVFDYGAEVLLLNNAAGCCCDLVVML